MRTSLLTTCCVRSLRLRRLEEAGQDEGEGLGGPGASSRATRVPAGVALARAKSAQTMRANTCKSMAGCMMVTGETEEMEEGGGERKGRDKTQVI
jgi:hypothetical protein